MRIHRPLETEASSHMGFFNEAGEITYVGRAQDVGIPDKVLAGRIARGHDATPCRSRPRLKPIRRDPRLVPAVPAVRAPVVTVSLAVPLAPPRAVTVALAAAVAPAGRRGCLLPHQQQLYARYEGADG